jgi:DNA processing protein
MSGARLTEEQLVGWLRLIRSEKIGPRTFRALVNQYGGASAALAALPDIARRSGRPLRIATRADAEREIAAAARLGVRYVALGEPDYPKALQAIDTAPPLIAVRGATAVLAKPMVAVVGSRNASAAGLTFTERLSRAVGEGGFVVVSGLARGIDARAHKAAMQTGTVAVLAGGQDRVYPHENEPLLEGILEHGGAVLSEMPFSWEPRGRDFPRRNRIVSGLCLGVVVVEAARRSGSLITARFALEQGREVFAVPGSPLDPRAEGTNDLIREGATLCASPEHVLAALEPLLGAPPSPEAGAGEPPHRTGDDAGPLWDELDLGELGPVPQAPYSVIGEREPLEPEADGDAPSRVAVFLGPSPVSVDDLARHSGLPIGVVQTALMELELAGRLERHGGNTVSLIAAPA